MGIKKLKSAITGHPLQSSKFNFEVTNITPKSRSATCRILRTMGNVRKAEQRPILARIHCEKRLSFAEKYMKLDFSRVVFSDECRATLDGPDGFATGWVLKNETPTIFRRQQGGGDVMFWGAIVDDEVIGPFRVPEGVKMNADNYISFFNG